MPRGNWRLIRCRETDTASYDTIPITIFHPPYFIYRVSITMKAPHPEDSPVDIDGLPSYDYATAQPPAEEYGAGPSTSSATVTAVPIPKNSLHLFNGPPNAEPLYGRIETTLGELGDIVTSTKGSITETRDPKLGNRKSTFPIQ
jgi:hypothetical protein